ncbi:MAG: hypothetical protein WBK55_05585 [Alphaproteobacteria bacterium]
MNTPTTNIEQKKIIRIYAAFGAGLALSFAPFLVAALISGALVIGVLCIAYVLRTDTEQGSLTENHMTFIIRTIWIGSFLALITLTIASIYLFKVLNNTPLQPCLDQILSMADPAAIESFAMNFMGTTCWAEYWQTNLAAFIVAFIITAAPVLLYFAVRYVRGVTRAMRGYRVANPKSWF